MTLPDGWLTEQEQQFISKVAEGKSVLELGAWKGRSTVVFARVATIVVSCDSHRGIAEVGGEPTLADFVANVSGFDNVIALVGDWTQADLVLQQEFDVVYVDGNHDAESACRDFLLARRLGRTILAHDWDMDSVRRGAIDASLPSPNDVRGSVAVWYG